MSGEVTYKDLKGIITKKFFKEYPSKKKKLLWHLQTQEKEELVEAWNEDLEPIIAIPEQAEVVIKHAEYKYSKFNKKLTAYIKSDTLITLGGPDQEQEQEEVIDPFNKVTAEGLHPDVQEVLDIIRKKWGKISAEEISKSLPNQPDIVINSALHILLDQRKIHETEAGFFIALSKKDLSKEHPPLQPANTLVKKSTPSNEVVFEEQGQKVSINPDDYLEEENKSSAITISTNKSDKEIKIEITIKVQ